MTRSAVSEPETDGGVPAGEGVGHDAGLAGLTASDLGDLVTAFNDVTSKLEASHEQLSLEVARLNDELRDANERLQRSRRLAELGEMAAGIAHEIRNPLASIGLYARLLEEDLPADDGPGETATKIARAVRRMDAIVTDVLAFAREDRVRPEPVDLAKLVRSAVDAALESATAGGLVAGANPAGVRIECLERGLPERVECDPLLTHQALANIVSNALQAVGESGATDSAEAMVVCGARITRELGPDGRRTEMVGLWVRDRGPGLPEGVIERMFNPFFTTREAGTGLGLAIVHRIADAHGGRVRAENNPGGAGATVELLLPCAVEADGTEECSVVVAAGAGAAFSSVDRMEARG
jgi:two-component system sensor histidine kinase PilS (NtrC family)